MWLQHKINVPLKFNDQQWLIVLEQMSLLLILLYISVTQTEIWCVCVSIGTVDDNDHTNPTICQKLLEHKVKTDLWIHCAIVFINFVIVIVTISICSRTSKTLKKPRQLHGLSFFTLS